MAGFKKFSNLVSVGQITNQVSSMFNDKINALVSDAQSGTLNEGKIEKELEPYIEKFDQIGDVENVISAATLAASAIKNPEKVARNVMARGIKNAIANSETVQNLKNEAMEEIHEKIEEFPNAKEVKDKIENMMKKADDIQLPQEPNLDPNLPSGQSLIAAAIRDSDLARKLLDVE